MKTVLITTDYSATSRHALDYACLLLQGKDVVLDLMHIFEVPVNYTSDGMALASIGSDIERAENLMLDEVEYVRTTYPEMPIEGRVITGNFLETVRQEIRLIRPACFMLGTGGFNELSFGDENPLIALRTMTVPVMFIPGGTPLKPIKQIAYACNYQSVGQKTPVDEITNMVNFFDARLHVVHSDAQAQGQNAEQTKGELWLQNKLSNTTTDFHWVQDADVLHGLGSFITGNDIDCVVAVPRKYGVWENMFHESRTKALARLNKVPVIAFHEIE